MGTRSSTLVILLAACSVVGFTGCRAWTGGYPLQSPSRVPPPGTGTYQVPSNYYNNPGTVSQAYSGGATNVAASNLNTGYPATNLVPATGVAPGTANAFGNAPVQPASFTTPTGSAPSSGIPSTNASQGASSFNFNDNGSQANLNWNR